MLRTVFGKCVCPYSPATPLAILTSVCLLNGMMTLLSIVGASERSPIYVVPTGTEPITVMGRVN